MGAHKSVTLKWVSHRPSGVVWIVQLSGAWTVKQRRA